MPNNVKTLLEDSDNEIFISIVSFWEIAIKKVLQKLTLKHSIDAMFKECENQQIQVLGISPQDIETVEILPFYHRDPFDRMIIAVGMNNGLEIIGVDNQFDQYAINRIW